jgi:hypothetical protein
MTKRHAPPFRSLRCFAAAALAVLAAGCSSTADLDAIAPLDAGEQARRFGTGPIDTGTYPNLNVAPKVATRQFTPEEAQAKHAALQAAQRRQSPGGRALTTEERRRLQLVEDQGDTLEIIEGRSAR